MNGTRSSWSLAAVQHKELAFCLRCNQLDMPRIERFFGHISRWGNGGFWMAMAFLAVVLAPTLAVTVLKHVALVGLFSTAIYKGIKRLTARPRPCAASGRIRQRVQPLDRYSFPSGHTLHAVAFALVLVHHLPILAWLVVPFTVLVALSRVILGLHYPTDVLAGALLGASIAGPSFVWF